ncbi:MAG: GNAT family N-acetyltransferase, partial [Planctomycetota bacterium]
HKTTLTPHQYVERVIAGRLIDSTLSFQLHNDFKVRGLLRDYLEDEASGNWATLIVWENPAVATA